MQFLRDLADTIKGSILGVVILLIFVLGLIGAGIMADKLYFEPKRQEAYQFKVSQEIADWCSSQPGDPWADGTKATLKSDRDGNQTQFDNLPFSLQQQIDAAIRGDREVACGG